MILMRCDDSDDRTRCFRRRLSLTDTTKSSAPKNPTCVHPNNGVQVCVHQAILNQGTLPAVLDMSKWI